MGLQLLDLPLEVLLNITKTLDIPDYGNLRLTCRAAETALFDAFAKEFFSTRQFMVTTLSLATLISISEHATFSRYIKKIIIGLDCLMMPGDVHNLDEQQMKVLQAEMNEQSRLIVSGWLSTVLSMAMPRMPNCHSIELRDFVSSTRPRGDGVWKSYGLSTWRQLRGQSVNHWRYKYSGSSLGVHVPSLLFNQLVTGFAISGIKCESVTVITTHKSNALVPDAFTLTPWQEKQTKQMLHSVKSFIVAIDLVNPRSTDGLTQFLAFLSNLEFLRVNGSIAGGWDLQRLGEDVPHAASGALAKVEALSSTLANGRLKRFELGKIQLEYESWQRLSEALRRGNTIQSLTFYNVRLSSPQWDEIMDGLDGIRSLKSVYFNNLFSGRGGMHNFHHVKFKINQAEDDVPHNLQDRVETRKLVELKSNLVYCNRDWRKKHEPDELSDSEDELTADDEDEDLDLDADTDIDDELDDDMEEFEDMVMGGIYT